MADTTNILSCSYGGESFVVIDYTVRETPNIDKDTASRVGTFVRVEIDGEIRATDPTTFSTQLLNVENAFRQDGLDLLIFGINGKTEYYLPASGSIDGGPHCGFELHRGESMLSKKVTCIVTTQQGPSGSNSTPSNTWTVRTSETPDGLQVVTWTGTLTGVNPMSSFLGTVWPNFRSAYGAISSGGAVEDGQVWSLKFTTDLSQPTSSTVTTLKYTMTATEYFGPLPADAAGNTAVEGTATQTVARDEHYRLTTTNEFNLLLSTTTDPIKILSAIRPTDGVILHETYRLETLKENRVSGSFTMLASADALNAPLMNYTQTARLQTPDVTYEEKRYVGAQPILIQQPARIPRLTMSGQATAAGKYYKPSPLYGSHLMEVQEITLTDRNDVEKEVSWNFSMAPLIGASSGGWQFVDLWNWNAGPLVRQSIENSWYAGVNPPASGTSADGST